MQNLNNELQYMLNNHRKKKRYTVTAVMLSFTVLLSVMVSLIRPAMSATKVMDPKETISDVEMLVGKNSSLLAGNDTIASVTDNAANTYALGIASQFCVFLQGDFKIYDADTEGRIAIGGILDASDYQWPAINGDGYRIGFGHYVSNTQSIPFDQCQPNLTGNYAHAIVGGHFNYNVATNISNELWRRFVITNESQIDSWYSDNEANYRWAFFKQDEDIINFESVFSMLSERSNTISENAKKSATSVSVNGNTVTFTGTGSDKTAESVMFNITQEQWKQISEISENVYFNFENIPKLENALNGTEVTGTNTVSDVTWENSYIIINVENSGEVKFSESAVFTSVNGTAIGKNTDGNLNNKFGCSSLLYNFKDATKVILGGDFQGTILAPSAAVSDVNTENGTEGCPGHLSGSLIAQSFDGRTEFGYRSYTGPLEIIEPDPVDPVDPTANYQIAVDKVDGERNFLQGATLGLYTVDDSGNLSSNFTESWTSGDSTKYLNVEANKKYAVKEISAPSGYSQTNDVYYFKVEESEKVSSEITSATKSTITLNSGSVQKLAWKSNPSVFDTVNVIITYNDGNSVMIDGKIIDDGSNDSWYQITNSANLYNVNKIEVIATGNSSQSCELAYYCDNEDEKRITITAGETVSVSYIPSVKMLIYNDQYFSNIKTSFEYTTTNLSQTYYDIDGTISLGSNLNSETNGVVIVSDNDKNFVFKDDVLLTPIIRLNSDSSIGNFTFVNTKIADDINVEISLQKVDQSDTNKTLSGAQIKLYANNGTEICSWTSFSGNQTITDDLKTALNNNNSLSSYISNDGYLKAGDYYFTEISSPNGYKNPGENVKMQFNISTNGSITTSSEYLNISGDTIKILNEKEDSSGDNLEIDKEWKDSNGHTIENPSVDKISVEIWRKYKNSWGSGSEWYSITNVLSNYQIFVEEDITTTSHMVGAIAAGENFTVGSWGEGQISPTVIGGEYQNGQFNPGSMLTDNQKAIASDKVYYNNVATGAPDISSNNKYIQKNDYINFDYAMGILKTESKKLTDGAVMIDQNNSESSSVYDGTILTIDLSKVGNNIEIPYSLFNSTAQINFTGVTLEQFARNGYIISVTGVDNNDVKFSFSEAGGMGTRIYLNEKYLAGNLKDLSNDFTSKDSQLNLMGMNLVFNFPDATSDIQVNYLSGQLVAPNADINLIGGNFEGCVIGKSLTSQGEGHFYSYLNIDEIKPFAGETGEGGSVSLDEWVKTVELTKEDAWKYIISDLPVKADDGNSYTYYLKEIKVDGYVTSYSDSDGFELVDGQTKIVTITNTEENTEQLEMPATGGLGVMNYYIAGGSLVLISFVGTVVKRRKCR